MAVGGSPRAQACLSDTQITYLWGLALEVSMERRISGKGMEAGLSLGHKIVASQSFIGCLPPCRPEG